MNFWDFIKPKIFLEEVSFCISNIDHSYSLERVKKFEDVSPPKGTQFFFFSWKISRTIMSLPDQINPRQILPIEELM